MYVERIPNRNSPPAILLRESYRDGNKFRRRTLANLSHWPPARIEALRCVLRDEAVAPAAQDALTLLRSLPHGHVAAALGTLRKIGLDRVLSQGGVQPRREVALCIAMIVARLIDPASKLATARGLADDTATSSLGQVLGLGPVDEQELYEALDWLVGQQQRIERALARRHLEHGTLVLYDVSSTYFEGRTCPLAKRGYNRDGKRHKLQIVFGLMCTTQGCPVAVEVFEGNVGDPSTLASQIEKVKQRFGIAHIVLIGDRGMITEARINETVKPAGINFITALRAPAIHSLVEAGSIQLSLFDQRDLAEVSSPDYPDERLIVCRNPLLADERSRKRRELLDATEQDLREIQARVRRAKRALRGKEKIGLAVGAVLNHHKVGKHFDVKITDADLTFERKTEQINAEALLDGIYVLRTDVKPVVLDAAGPYGPIKILLPSNALSEVSRPSTSKSGRSTIAGLSAFGRTCCCACSHTTSNGICGRSSSPSCSTITTEPRPKRHVLLSLRKPNVPLLANARSQPSAPTTACPSTASALLSPILPRSRVTP